MSKRLILVAVRLKSSRLKEKATADVDGKPMLIRLTERVRQSQLADQVIWCTSAAPGDDRLEELAHEYGVEIFRGSALDVMGRFIAVAHQHGAHTVARVTGDNPLTDPRMLDIMFRAHEDAQSEYTYTDDLPVGTRAEIIDVTMLARLHHLVRDPNSSEYMTYMLKRPDLFRTLEVPTPHTVLNRPEIRLTVDTDEDLQVIRSIYAAFDGAPPGLEEIIQWLDANPQVKNLNRELEPTSLPTQINCSLVGDEPNFKSGFNHVGR